MKKTPTFKSEEEFAEIVVKWLKKNGWEVYQEVQGKAYSGIADIVAKKGDVYWIIECKLSLGFKVMAQADDWKGCANHVSVAVPYSNRTIFKEKICKLLDIGVIAVSNNTFAPEKDVIDDKWVITLVKAPAQELKSKCLIKVLTEKHKTYAKAGNNYGKRITPFSNMVEALTEYVKKNPDCILKEAVTKIEHHYASTNSACACIKKYIADDIIKGFELYYEVKKRKLKIKLKEPKCKLKKD